MSFKKLGYLILLVVVAGFVYSCRGKNIEQPKPIKPNVALIAINQVSNSLSDSGWYNLGRGVMLKGHTHINKRRFSKIPRTNTQVRPLLSNAWNQESIYWDIRDSIRTGSNRTFRGFGPIAIKQPRNVTEAKPVVNRDSGCFHLPIEPDTVPSIWFDNHDYISGETSYSVIYYSSDDDTVRITFNPKRGYSVYREGNIIYIISHYEIIHSFIFGNRPISITSTEE